MTFVKADATDEETIKGACETAVKQEGQLDVFFANVWQRNQVTFFLSSRLNRRQEP